MKKKNIVDMALTFTAMMRVFAAGSKENIARKLEETFPLLGSIESQEEYDEIHRSFCTWFIGNIKTAEKTLKNGRVKESHYASYGHAAKVFDIAVKVYVHYCCQPSPELAKKILPLLKGAVDTPIMKHLCSKYEDASVNASTIEDVGYESYKRLQSLVLLEIKTDFDNKIFPVEYDDIMWNRLNRNKSA